MSDKGLYKKYTVHRVDGEDTEGGKGKHDGCYHFVLDLTCDSEARKAAMIYALFSVTLKPRLALDLLEKVLEIEPNIVSDHTMMACAVGIEANRDRAKAGD